jgi:hypothetical protein
MDSRNCGKSNSPWKWFTKTSVAILKISLLRCIGDHCDLLKWSCWFLFFINQNVMNRIPCSKLYMQLLPICYSYKINYDDLNIWSSKFCLNCDYFKGKGLCVAGPFILRSMFFFLKLIGQFVSNFILHVKIWRKLFHDSNLICSLKCLWHLVKSEREALNIWRAPIDLEMVTSYWLLLFFFADQMSTFLVSL